MATAVSPYPIPWCQHPTLFTVLSMETSEGIKVILYTKQKGFRVMSGYKGDSTEDCPKMLETSYVEVHYKSNPEETVLEKVILLSKNKGLFEWSIDSKITPSVSVTSQTG